MHRYKLQVKREKALFRGIREARARRVPLELIVKANGSKEKIAGELEKVGKVKHVFEFIPYISFACDASDAEGINRALNREATSNGYKALGKLISAIEVSSKVAIPKPKISAKSYGSWNLENIGAYEAQKISCGETVRIGVIDTGVDYEHPEISYRFGSRKGFNFVDGTMPLDKNGHGTHVAGVIAGAGCGIATACELYSLKVLDRNGEGNEADTMAAIEWALKNEVDVVNMSLGSPVASRALEDICYYAASRGLILVAAAGNNGYGPSYPASFDDAVISVAAVDSRNRHADFSNIYETNDISAPGVHITSCYLGGYATLSGTSMAAPHVTGSIGLAIPVAREKDVEELMKKTALPLGDEEEYGAGLLKADKMVAEAAARVDYAKAILQMAKKVVW
ncbi:S8 family peptidase [Candidatus Woesearchaeota archaeon]|nr:S8 family peptidase [Candidatus Woesearchaeota archaeon]